jgi:hypothetical protein
MVIESGDLYIDSTDIGAVKSGATFTVEQEIFHPELAGARGGIAGTGKVVTETATLTCAIAEVTVGKLIQVIPTLASSSDATSEYTTTPNVGLVGSSAYVTVMLQTTTTNSKTMQILLYNALAEGGLTMNFEDGAETTYEITFRSYYSSSTPKQRAWKVAIQR